jgi:hypothetical protein
LLICKILLGWADDRYLCSLLNKTVTVAAQFWQGHDLFAWTSIRHRWKQKSATSDKDILN